MEVVAVTERILAYHGPVELLKWQDSSGSGPKVVLGLSDRGELDHFDQATRRNKRKAGQQYRCYFQDKAGNNLKHTPDECWFFGGNWSHQQGATIALAFTEEHLAWFKTLKTRDNSETGERFYLALVELDDAGAPINQAKAKQFQDVLELKGGPKSKFAARRNKDVDFQRWVGHRMELDHNATVEQCDAWIKKICAIHSKRLFDYSDPVTGEEYWDRYQKWVERPFLAWGQAGCPALWDSPEDKWRHLPIALDR